MLVAGRWARAIPTKIKPTNRTTARQRLLWFITSSPLVPRESSESRRLGAQAQVVASKINQRCAPRKVLVLRVGLGGVGTRHSDAGLCGVTSHCSTLRRRGDEAGSGGGDDCGGSGAANRDLPDTRGPGEYAMVGRWGYWMRTFLWRGIWLR